MDGEEHLNKLFWSSSLLLVTSCKLHLKRFSSLMQPYELSASSACSL